MTVITDLTNAEKAQVRAVYGGHVTGSHHNVTFNHDVCRALIEKHLAQESRYGFPIIDLTARGIEIAEQISPLADGGIVAADPGRVLPGEV